MKKSDIPAFLAMALYGCGFLASFELMQSRPEPFTGITTAALAHLVCVFLFSIVLPICITGGRKGRVLVGIGMVVAMAVRLPGVSSWLNDWLVRSAVQAGQAMVAATSFWLFFRLTPQDKWVDRFVLAWLTGMAGKECIVAIGGRSSTALYLAVGLVIALNVIAVLVCLAPGRFPPAEEETESGRSGWRPLLFLFFNTVIVAVALGFLSGWVGSFYVDWADTSPLAPRLAAPAMLVVAGWSLRHDFTVGFVRMVRLCAVLCLALAGMAVLKRETVAVDSIPYLAVGCQTAFYTCMTLAMARLANSTRWLGLAAITPYAAMIASGLAAYGQPPLAIISSA